MASASFTKLATVTASTKRSPATGGDGKRGLPATNIASLSCTPLDPVSAEVQQRLRLDTPHELLESYMDADLDVLEGDILVVGSREYPIRAVAEWSWRGSEYLHVVVEELKR